MSMKRIRPVLVHTQEAPHSGWKDKILQGHCVSELAKLPPASVDVIFADDLADAADKVVAAAKGKA